MTSRQKRKGDRAELEAARLLTQATGHDVRRRLGAGRTDDEGDLEGIDGWALQVADWQDLATAIRVKPVDAEHQALVSGLPHAAALIRLRGGQFRVVMTLEQWARLVTTDDVRQE